MFNNNHSSTLYLYSYRDHGWIASFESEDKLISYMVTHYSAFFGENNDVNLTWKDTKVVHLYGEEAQTYLRNYVLIDSNNRVINPVVYKERVDAIINSYDSSEMEHMQLMGRLGFSRDWRAWYHKEPVDHDDLSYGDILVACDTNYRFRCDPVPGIGRNRWHFGCFYRYPRTTQELRTMADPEMEPYIRKARKQIPTVWDDIPRGRQRNWKRQGKKRKQWM